MDFKGHSNGGILAGSLSVAVGVNTGFLDLQGPNLEHFINSPLDSGDFKSMVAVFVTGWFMAVFPDLDTTSTPQKWFIRVMFALLGLVFLADRMDLFVVLAFASLLPLLHHHRGWTHWKAAPWLVSVGLAVVFEIFRAKNSWISGFSWNHVLDFLSRYWMYVFAAVVGHYTHLFLDSKQVRGMWFIRNAEDHH
ncbi:MAG: metal-dependent hydrolase [Deltaproteobacteria bacterium]|nr:metal-dependent hydrolase [Deltaproteobacteria bacterium]